MSFESLHLVILGVLLWVSMVTIDCTNDEIPQKKSIDRLLYETRRYQNNIYKRGGRRLTSSWDTSDSSSDSSDDYQCSCGISIDSSSWSTSSSSSSSSSSTSSKSSSGSGKWSTDTADTTDCGKSNTNYVSSNTGKWSTDTDTMDNSTNAPCNTGSTSTSLSPSSSAVDNSEYECICDCMCSSSSPSTTSGSWSSDHDSKTSSSSGKWSTDTMETTGASSGTMGTTSTGTGTNSKSSSSSGSGKWSTDTMESTIATTTTYDECVTECRNGSTTEACSGDYSNEYIELEPRWELFSGSNDETYVYDGIYVLNDDDDEFEQVDGNYSIWFEHTNSDYFIVIGDRDVYESELWYLLGASSWTDTNNPFVDSSDSSKWEPSDELAEFVTATMTLYDCNSNEMGTDLIEPYVDRLIASSSHMFNVKIGLLFAGMIVAMF